MIIAGLALTVIAWVYQLYLTVGKKDSRINPVFLGVYAAGCILLAIGSFLDKEATSGFLNAVDAILPVTILLIITIARKEA